MMNKVISLWSNINKQMRVGIHCCLKRSFVATHVKKLQDLLLLSMKSFVFFHFYYYCTWITSHCYDLWRCFGAKIALYLTNLRIMLVSCHQWQTHKSSNFEDLNICDIELLIVYYLSITMLIICRVGLSHRLLTKWIGCSLNITS